MTRKRLEWNKVQQLCLPQKSTMALLCKTGLSSCIIPSAASKASVLQEQKQRDFYQSLARLSARAPPPPPRVPLMIIELLSKDKWLSAMCFARRRHAKCWRPCGFFGGSVIFLSTRTCWKWLELHLQCAVWIEWRRAEGSTGSERRWQNFKKEKKRKEKMT